MNASMVDGALKQGLHEAAPVVKAVVKATTEQATALAGDLVAKVKGVAHGIPATSADLYKLASDFSQQVWSLHDQFSSFDQGTGATTRGVLDQISKTEQSLARLKRAVLEKGIALGDNTKMNQLVSRYELQLLELKAQFLSLSQDRGTTKGAIRKLIGELLT